MKEILIKKEEVLFKKHQNRQIENSDERECVRQQRDKSSERERESERKIEKERNSEKERLREIEKEREGGRENGNF